MNRLFICAFATLAGALAGCGQSSAPPAAATPAALSRAACGPGDQPETGLQGEVTQDDVSSGRAAKGFTCNTVAVGSYTTPNAVGTVGGFRVERYTDAAGHDCAFYDTTLLYPTNIFTSQTGVNVMDMADPTKPVRTAELVTPAMDSPHESLRVNQKRGLLAAVLGNPAMGPGVVDVYDVSQDCRHPVFKSSLPVGTFGHESGFSEDGLTFYSASPGTPTLTPIDVSNPSLPVPLAVAQYQSHGLTPSADGNRIYVADATGKRLLILDSSDFQSRKAQPQFRQIAALTWDTVSIPQNAIPVTIKGHPYLMEIDEFGANQQVGAARMIDIGDETHPKVISNMRLEVHQPENFAREANDPGAGNTTVGGYAGHYCNVPSAVDPPIVACSMILSGLRVFDIRDPYHPHEVAYFNAPTTDSAVLQVPFGGNWAMSSPAFVPERKEIWYTDGLNGFWVVRVTNGMWP
jgi:hypothetical protein